MLPRVKVGREESSGCTVDAGEMGEGLIECEAIYSRVLVSDRCCEEKPRKMRWFWPRFWWRGVFSSRTLLNDKLMHTG